MSNNDKPKHVSSLLDLFTKDEILKRAQLEREKSYDIRTIFEQMELDLIASMRRAFYFHQAEQIKEGFEWEQWQLTKLREIEKYRKRNKALVESYNKPIQDAIDRELKQSYTKGEGRIKQFINKLKHLFNKKVAKQQSIMLPSDTSSAQPLRDYIAKATGMPKKIPPETNFFGVNDKKLEALMKSVNKDLEKAQYSVLRKMDDVYRQTIFKSQLYMQGGAKTLYQAIDMATKDFLDKGINSIVYADGKRVNIASYAEMALRTASHRATLLGEGKKRDEWGLHLIVVSAHANTCPKCEKWQGKILIDDVFSSGSKSDGDYPLLSEAIKAGLLHPNCRHTLITYFPDITQLPTVPDGEDAIKTYEAEQKQRAYERKIRKWKRYMEGSLDNDNAKTAEQKVAYYEKALREHLKEHPQLRRNQQREKIYGTTAVNKVRSLKSNNGNAKIEEVREYIKSGQQPLNIEVGKQGKHMLDHPNYIDGRSYLTISVEEAQKLINQYAGTGDIVQTKNGDWAKKESIAHNKEIGVCINNITGEKTSTNKFKIHYSKKGTHIVPTVKGSEK